MFQAYYRNTRWEMGLELEQRALKEAQLRAAQERQALSAEQAGRLAAEAVADVAQPGMVSLELAGQLPEADQRHSLTDLAQRFLGVVTNFGNRES
jgi:uncharacterized Zn finger protein